MNWVHTIYCTLPLSSFPTSLDEARVLLAWGMKREAMEEKERKLAHVVYSNQSEIFFESVVYTLPS